MGNYRLSDTEMEIMQYMWNHGEKISFKQLLEHFNSDADKNWKKQTLCTYLTKLRKLGLLNADGQGKNFVYYPAMTKTQYQQKWVKEFINDVFDGSIGKFVAAFTGGESLNPDEAEELKRYIDDK